LDPVGLEWGLVGVKAFLCSASQPTVTTMLSLAQNRLSKLERLCPHRSTQTTCSAPEQQLNGPSPLAECPSVVSSVTNQFLAVLTSLDPAAIELRQAYIDPAFGYGVPGDAQRSALDDAVRAKLLTIKSLLRVVLTDVDAETAVVFVEDKPQHMKPTIFFASELHDRYEDLLEQIHRATTDAQVEQLYEFAVAISMAFLSASAHELVYLLLRFARSLRSASSPLTLSVRAIIMSR
jgi:hypothetical protein